MTLDLQPTLFGPQLLLRPLEPADREALYAVASDPLIWADHPAHDRHLPAVFERYFDEAIASGGALLAVESASNAAIGSSRFSFEFAQPGEVEIGWTFLARQHWGGPMNREMKRLMLRHAFTEVETAMFRVAEQNVRSRRAMEKIGARLTERRESASVGGRDVIHVIYTIARADFLHSPLNLEGAA
ncbi:MAG: GNAT family N-acetyltransferase [Pseudomonadota bacterium]|nr:GNAT family N-acetyltransferase [Pseudomonadota bacterium]